MKDTLEIRKYILFKMNYIGEFGSNDFKKWEFVFKIKNDIYSVSEFQFSSKNRNRYEILDDNKNTVLLFDTFKEFLDWVKNTKN